MPRLTESRRDERRTAILTAATRLFAENGFHNTSMASVIADSGMSAGAVYSFFHSKEELIGSVADIALAIADDVFTDLLADDRAPSPAEAVSALVEAFTSRLLEQPVDMSRIAVHIWSESLRNPQLRERVTHVLVRLRAYCAEIARRRRAAGLLPGDASPDQVGAAMLGLLQGYVLQRLLIPSTDEAYYVAGLRDLLEAP